MPRHERFTIDVDVTPRFTACYLRVAGDECAFIEAHTAHATPRLLAALGAHGKRPEDVRYVVVTHAHLDHAAGAGALLAKCPNATLLAHPRTARHLVDPDKLVRGAKAVYGEDRFRALYGEVPPIPEGRVRALGDGEAFELGGATLTVWETFGHAFHHFVVDDPATETVYTGDTFGLVYPDLQRHGRFAIPSTSPTGFDAAEARRSLDKVLALGERTVCPTHFDGYDDAKTIAAQLRRFIDRAEAWVEGAASEGARHKDEGKSEGGGADDVAGTEAWFAAQWWKAIAEEGPKLDAEERAFLKFDVELNSQGLAYVANARRGA
jgi:glyoxylase-like metal-dependent hydrolase (beta-lactamase superfamily II)